MLKKDFFKDRKNIILSAIIILAVFLIFFRLTRADFRTDGSHYSVRAIGYVDYLMSQLQTTPLQWFNEIPWWANLAMHDHPPLVFLIQHIFFVIFGVSDMVALMPFALAGIGSVFLLYLIGTEIRDKKFGLVAALVLAASTFFISFARMNYLESVEILFILLSFLFLIKALKQDKYFIHFGIFLGLAFLTKYTAFFLAPLLVLAIFLRKKKLFFNKKFILGMLLAIIIFLPVIIYNLMTYKTRGHFDLQFSLLFSFTHEAAREAWPVLFENQAKPTLRENFLGIWSGLKIGFSYPFYILGCTSIAYLAVQFLYKFKKRKRFLLPSMAVFSLCLMFLFIAPNARYLPIFTPFIALAIAILFFDLYNYLQKKSKDKAKYIMALVFIPVLLIEVQYNFNTNHAISPKGEEGKNYSSLRLENLGYKELDKKLQERFTTQTYYSSRVKNIKKTDDLILSLNDIMNKDLYIHDSNLNWFSTVWYLQRHLLYHEVFFVSDADLVGILGLEENWFEFFKGKGVRDIYYIKGIEPGVFGGISDMKKELSEELVKIIESNKGIPGWESFEVKNDKGQVAFRVYKMKLN